MKPSREIDRDVCEKVFGLKVLESAFNTDLYWTEHGLVKHYSSALEDSDEIRKLFASKDFDIQKRFSEAAQKAVSARLSVDHKVYVPEWQTFILAQPIDLCVAALAVFSGGKS